MADLHSSISSRGAAFVDRDRDGCLQDVALTCVAGSPAKTYGINVRGLRRRDFGDEVIAELRELYKQKFRGRSVPNNAQSPRGSHISSPEAEQLLEFLSQSQRGVIR